LREQKCFFFYRFSYFWILRFFLVKRHKTFFGFGFKSFFFGLVILFFWFWVLYILYLVLVFYIHILFYIGYSPFYSVSPFLFGPLFYSVSPFYSVSKDQINFYLSSIRSCSCSCCFKSSSSVDCSYLQNVLELLKYANTHDKCYYTTIKHAPVFLFLCFLLSVPLAIPLAIPLKKTTSFYPLRI
jgi:hypothetical protein